MGSQIVVLAERVGFEPTGLLHPQVFKTSSLNRSDISPEQFLTRYANYITRRVPVCQPLNRKKFLPHTARIDFCRIGGILTLTINFIIGKVLFA